MLVPGCGTGRLAFDACLAGYTAQGSDFSLQMLFASNMMLNTGAAAGEWTIHPFIHDSSNHLTAADMLRGVAVPDVAPGAAFAAARPHGADFSMAGGDFASTFARPSQRGAWDAILSVFFLDTAPVLHEYLDAMHHALRPGGVLINFGPLLWHWQAAADDGGCDDDRHERSLELPYEDVAAALAATGFRVVKEVRGLETTYAANSKSMQRTVFSCVLTVCERL